jgi:hypothetical protein|tara:strand:- start:121 stop:375 length:255 start_codon:yes stop_codon:yes gene_type:complete
MTNRKSLYARLTPETKARLEKNGLQYEFTVTRIIKKLDSTYFWSDLTVNDVSNLIIFSDSDFEYNSINVNCGVADLIEPENNVI